MIMRLTAVFLTFLSGSVLVDSFTPSTRNASAKFSVAADDQKSVAVRMSPDDNNSDPFKSLLDMPANSLQNLLKPLKEGKKMVVKSLAGDYDEKATLAKLNGFINDNRILMLSFTT